MRRAEQAGAVLLTLVYVLLHVVKALNAGPLWRDEAGAVGVANLPSLRQVFTQFPHEAFPMLFPVTVRAVTHLAGGSDLGFRVFGLLVGLGILVTVWVSIWQMCRGAPLLSLALLGFNGALLQWGDSLRGYGMGTAFIILFTGLLWRVVDKPNRRNALWATFAAIAAVQCLLHSAPLILALCVAGTAVAIRRRSSKLALLVLSIGFVAAVTLLPYLGPLAKARHWDVMVRTTTPPGFVLVALGMLGPPASASAWIWGAAFLGAIGVCLCGKRITNPADGPRQRELLLFCFVALLLVLVTCLAFLEVLRYIPRAWYYLALLAVIAVLMDAAFNQLRHPWASMGRLVVVAAIMLVSLGPAWRIAHSRQSNMDLIAGKLNSAAAKGDLIVVRPWALGISFARYYTSSAPWMTVPPIQFHAFHRYDLIQGEMGEPDNVVLQPLCNRIKDTLKAGGTVWFIGELSWSAVSHETETPASAKSQQWAQELGTFLRQSVSHLEAVPISCSQSVNEFEHVPLWKLNGWSLN